ncbi:MAG TPA: type 4a pilus biogenesis protein PilO [Myxococcota bacterium]|nr:type 4a pilus biogenesis protein PilO [Myxococcota bacterium]
MAIGQNIDAQKLLQKFERMPAPMRSAVLGAIALAVIGLYMVLFFGSNQAQLRTLQTRHAKVEQDISAAKAVANNLDAFKRKREELGQQLQAALEKLPESSDLPALLTNISTLGKKSGLEIQTFKQGKKIDRGFYSEQQIELQFTGFYHDIALFFDRVASLSRIVNLTELTFDVEKDTGESPTLKVKGIAATFYFNDSSKTTPAAPAAGAAPAKGT